MAGNKQRAVFRLEFGGGRGWGHLVRCAALAQELQRRDWTCVLWTSGSLDGVSDELRRAFPETVGVTHNWPAAPPPEASHATQLVIDLYDFSDEELETLRNRLHRAPVGDVPGLLVMDDEARRTLAGADLILNSRLGLAVSPYAAQVPALLGEKYALLRSGLNDPAVTAHAFAPRREPILIMFGGTDPAQRTATALNALADVGADRFVPIVVRAQSLPGGQSIAEALMRFPESQQVERLDAASLAGWARLCRFAITAAGGTTYELAFLRLPFVAVVVAPNQRNQARAIARHWQLPVVDVTRGHRRAIAAAVRGLANSAAGEQLASVDGKGAARVADAIER